MEVLGKGCAGRPDDLKSQFLPQFLAIEPNFAQKRVAPDDLKSQFYTVFGDRTSFRAKGLCQTTWTRNLTRRSNLISCEKVAATGRLEIAILPHFLEIEPHFVRKGCAGRPDDLKSQFLPQFLAIEPHFAQKSCAGRLEIAILPQFLAIEPHFVRKGCAGRLEIAIWPQFLHMVIAPHIARKGCAGPLEIAILLQFLAIESHFVRKGCDGTPWNRNFTSVFGDRTSFCAKGLRFVPSRWHCLAPSREK